LAEQPYIKWWTSDFLNGVMDLTADEIGVYAVLLTLMADRGGPITNDSQWLARRCGTTTRAFNRIRDRLVELGKLELRSGLIGNRRMLAEIKERDRKSQQASQAAHARWAKWAEEHPLSLPFDEKNGEKTGEKLPEKLAKNRQKNSPVKSEKPQKSANSAMRTVVLPSCARARPELELESNHTNNHETESVVRASSADRSVGSDDGGEGATPTLRDADLTALLSACAEAAGFYPNSPGALAREIEVVKAWREAGIDFDATVLPAIRAVMAKSGDPTSSLKRFDRRVRHDHAKAAGSPPSKPRTPATPLLTRQDEPPVMKEFRTDLLAALGPSAFTTYCNRVRFEDLGKQAGGKAVLKVHDPMPGGLGLMDGERTQIVRSVARKHGWTAIW
jgi:uncharacterized protein YdaU (DUF1376 family)